MASIEEQNQSNFNRLVERVGAVFSHVSGDQQGVWMRLLGSVVLNLPVKRQLDGKDTNLGTEISWLPTNFGNVMKALGLVGQQLAEVLELLKQIAASQKVEIDYDKLAAANAKAIGELVESVEQTTKTTTMNLKDLPELEDLGEVK